MLIAVLYTCLPGSAMISPICIIMFGMPNTTKVTKDQFDFIHWTITL